MDGFRTDNGVADWKQDRTLYKATGGKMCNISQNFNPCDYKDHHSSRGKTERENSRVDRPGYLCNENCGAYLYLCQLLGLLGGIGLELPWRLFLGQWGWLFALLNKSASPDQARTTFYLSNSMMG